MPCLAKRQQKLQERGWPFQFWFSFFFFFLIRYAELHVGRPSQDKACIFRHRIPSGHRTEEKQLLEENRSKETESTRKTKCSPFTYHCNRTVLVFKNSGGCVPVVCWMTAELLLKKGRGQTHSSVLTSISPSPRKAVKHYSASNMKQSLWSSQLFFIAGLHWKSVNILIYKNKVLSAHRTLGPAVALFQKT